MSEKLDNNRALCEQLIKVFGKRLREIFDEQADGSEKYKIENFDSCYEQAELAMYTAVESPIRILALASAKHYEDKDKHKINTLDEQADLMGVMDGEEIEVASASAWRA